MTRGALVRWLQGLGPHELGEVLRRRPDALVAPSPGDLTQLAARLSTRTAVTEVLATLPLPALQVIEALARLGGPPTTLADLAADLDRAPDDAELQATLRVLSQRALVWPDGDDLWTTPALLLEASGPAAEPFAPVPPAPSLVPADRAAIRTAAGESAADLLQYAAAVLAEAPFSRQRNGGVATREHARLAAALGLDEPLVAHFADVVLHAGLLAPDGTELEATTAAAAWTAAPLPERLARLLSAWWSGPPLRRVVIRVLHDLPPDTAVRGTDSLAALVRWTAPRPSRSVALPEVVSGIVAEATLLGVCVMLSPDTFAISPLGRALADGRSLVEVATPLLPAVDVRVLAAQSVVVSADPAALDEVAAALHLTRVAPTVAISPDGVASVRAALGAAFRPPAAAPAVSAPRPARPRPAVDPVDLAHRLSVPLQRNASALEQIRHRAPQLRPEQAQLLADAVEHGTPIWIRYVDANGRASERVIENAELAGSVIEAWCRLRRDDRAFTLNKIVAVARPRH
ncbi:hypothetical protein Dvina_48455 [Dactylosporangium vinaceum]|uniref:Helicase XPB/Ssl2 N-terminal domain-containing protein n=1 Tax=Dactylosporangium vinaceum TaxID=53362 RepID=A0ABV5MNZ5_9ACTN|nr:hypothetical protein [Dactylosporangium vinaceum]UAB95740.1 hypothetical protein Dvina_48455 [Dactylosporangium vinaceum]